MQRPPLIETNRQADAEPPPLSFVFVVTYGRSGSTLVQGLLNTLPRTLVRGENNLYVLHLYRAMALARDFQEKFGGTQTAHAKSAFYGLDELRVADFGESTRELVTKQLIGDADRSDFDVVGFKEVLWHRVQPAEDDDFFHFMDDAFPGVKYVLNRRRHDDVAQSGFWQHRKPGAADKAIARIEELQQHLRATRSARVYDTKYEVLTSKEPDAVDAHLRGLAEFVVGSCDDDLLGDMRQTLTVGHGPNPFGKSKTKGSAR